MAQINLRDYLKRIDELVDREKYDEGMAHAAHVLRVFPKNLQALRDLGRALFGLSRLAEAEDVFRRVLSANLLDVTAHNYLSLIYERGKQIPLAIWHAERAFDQQPGNKSIVQRLRELYSAQHGQAIDKLPLTAGALANYALSQEPAQALEVLEKALEREPTRLDLRLQLARALWAADRPIDAAETALSILENLPYAMQANRIMTELWLAQGRPSDAARHLSRLEEVDPYLALRLASGETPDPDAILLEELDYMAHANRQLANSVPDWLMALDDDMSDEDPFAQLATDESSDILPPDVARNIEALRGVSATETMPPKSRKPRTGALPPQEKASTAPGKLSKADDEAFLRELEARQPSIRTSTGLTGLLGDNLDDDDAWLNDISDSEAPLPGTPTRAPTGLTGLLGQTASDDDSWLHALEDADPFKQDDAPSPSPPRASTGLTGNFFDDIDDTPPTRGEVELPEWLRDDYALPAPASRPKSDTDEFIAASDALDPLAWMQEAGAELDENAPNARRLNLVEDDGPTIIRSNPINPMAWLSDADGDFLDAANSTPSAPSFLDDEASASEEHPLAWLQDESLLSTDALNEDRQADTVSASADFDQPWFADDDALQEVMDFETLVGADDSASQGQQDAMNNDPLFPDDDSWLSDDADKGQRPEDSSDWLAEFDDELSAEANEEADPLAWMQGYGVEVNPDPASPLFSAQATDWLNDSLIEEASESSAEVDWMADFGAVSTTQDEPLAQDEPDWMADFGAVSTTQDEPLAQDEPDWMADFGAVGTAITDDEEEFASSEEEAVEKDQLDWMMDFSGVGQQVGAQIEDNLTNASSESFDQDIWDSADETEAEAESDAYQIDWLSDVANAEEQDELQAEEVLSFNPADNAPDWLNAMVPGLDMDFAADEDAVVDVGFVDASSHRQRELSADDFVSVNRGGIQWLHDLIEEEQQAAATLPPPPPPLPLPPTPALASLPSAPQVVQGPLSSAPSTRLRFIFSRPPAWVSALKAQSPAAQKRAAAVAQQEDDDDLEDFDLADFDDLDLDDFDELDDKRKK